MADTFFVYILATRKDGPLYVGITSDLHKRVFEHKTHAIPGFTARYNVDRLVYFEIFEKPGSSHCPRKAAQEMAPRLEG